MHTIKKSARGSLLLGHNVYVGNTVRCDWLFAVYDVYISKDEEIRPSLAYKVLSAQNTKKLMTVENVGELAW